MNARQHERVEGRVRELVHSGEAAIETERGIVFARFGAPSEQVLLSLDEASGKVRRGRILKVLTPSAERVEPPCPYVQRCGGCPFMHLSQAAQQAEKRRFLRDALVRAGAPAELEVHFTSGQAQLGYRRRARLSFRVSGGLRELGYRRERSREAVDIAQCAVLEPVLNQALSTLRAEVLPQLAGEGEVLLARGKQGNAVALVRAQSAQDPALYATAARLVDEAKLEGLALWVEGTSLPARFGAPEEWTESFDGVPMEGTVGGFSQAQTEVNGQLVQRVLEKARTSGARVVELYAGHGNLTVGLAKDTQSYTAVEQDRDAVAALRKNLAQRGLKAKVVEGDALQHVSPGAFDVLVLDPPRAGAKGVLAPMTARKVRRVVYVSCDPTTLGRDVGPLLQAGFQISWAEGFDMFPQTADLESLVVLER